MGVTLSYAIAILHRSAEVASKSVSSVGSLFSLRGNRGGAAASPSRSGGGDDAPMFGGGGGGSERSSDGGGGGDDDGRGGGDSGGGGGFGDFFEVISSTTALLGSHRFAAARICQTPLPLATRAPPPPAAPGVSRRRAHMRSMSRATRLVTKTKMPRRKKFLKKHGSQTEQWHQSYPRRQVYRPLQYSPLLQPQCLGYRRRQDDTDLNRSPN